MNEKVDILSVVASQLLNGEKATVQLMIRNKYPFVQLGTSHRSYSENQKMQVFIRDGFIDRYTGDRLINPGFLKVLSFYYPAEFPYQAHWKMTECHNAYWELCPTLDHLEPIARGGADEMPNWVTTSMLNNSVKSNWTLEQLKWKLYEPGNLVDWDGLTAQFIELVKKDAELLNDAYIKKWYKVSVSNRKK